MPKDSSQTSPAQRAHGTVRALQGASNVLTANEERVDAGRIMLSSHGPVTKRTVTSVEKPLNAFGTLFVLTCMMKS